MRLSRPFRADNENPNAYSPALARRWPGLVYGIPSGFFPQYFIWRISAVGGDILGKMTSDLELLQDYARNKSEESFTALVHRHLNLVYSAALRQVRSPQLAEEVVQSAFMDLARQAQQLAPDTILTAWLYHVTPHRHQCGPPRSSAPNPRTSRLSTHRHECHRQRLDTRRSTFG